MELQFHGANCITLTTKNVRLTIDDNLADLGAKSVAKPDDIALFTGAHGDPAQTPRLMIDLPGEYEMAGVSIYGIPARAHIDEADKKSATLYKIVVEDLKILVTGHVYPELTENQLESIGMVDVMLVPVGGNGYTLDGIGALALIKKVEPKVVIPTHYADKDLHFPVPQAALEDALQALAMEVKETMPKLKLKSLELSDSTQLIVLERS
ncbi:MAG TPA: MBL fold metallo-hydrolase [Candidatus Saccharimonadales bacterium]|nr:MBL fold metallo-hydrolase [Candidatus Saccharimonadales bacterium]